MSDFVLPWDLVSIVFDVCKFIFWLRRISCRMPPLKIDGGTSSVVGKVYARDLIARLPLRELETRHALARVLRLCRAGYVLYPYEEKPLERALLDSSRSVGAVSIGYAHSFANAGLLYFRVRQLSGNVNPPKPDQIVCTGPIMQDWLCDWGKISTQKMHVVGSHRYHEPLKQRSHAERLKVLLLISQGHEMERFERWAADDPELFNQVDLTVRLYPLSWYEVQLNAVERLRAARVEFTVSDGARPISEDLAPATVVLFCSTSAGIEAILSGKIAIYLDLNDIFNLDPTLGKSGGEKILRAGHIGALRQQLDRIQSLTLAEYGEIWRGEHEFANGVYQKFDLHALQRCLGVGGHGAT